MENFECGLQMKRNMNLPGNAPKAFIIPKTLPECFGAKSWGLTKQAELWKPAQKMQRVISNSAKVNDDLPTKPKKLIAIVPDTLFAVSCIVLNWGLLTIVGYLIKIEVMYFGFRELDLALVLN